MSTPQGPNPPHDTSPDGGAAGAAGAAGPSDHTSEQPAWGQQPPGGWGQQAWDQQQGWGQQPQGDQQAGGRPQPGQQAWGQTWGQQPTQQWGQQWGQQDWSQQPQQGWGPPTQQAPAARKKSPLPWILVVAAVVVVLAAVGVLGFWKPGFFVTRVFDQTALQDGVQQVLTREYGHEVSDVSCGQEIQVTNGATFTCDATVDGERLKVPVTVTSDDGNYQVGRV